MQIVLPDFLANWPWHRRLSPYYAETKAESSAWVESFELFGAKEQKAFNKCDFNLLGSLTYPKRSRDFVRAACDLMNFYFVYDEYTDVADKSQAQKMADFVRDALRNPYDPRPSNDVIGEFTRQFWQRALALTDPKSPCIEHFITGFDDYIDAVSQEADDRNKKRVRNVEDYLQLRYGTTSAKSIFALIEFGLNLPEEVLQHPTVARLTHNAALICGITNDMHSYSLEQARGLDGHNIITSIIQEHNLDLQSSFNWLGNYTKNLVDCFLSDLQRVPSWDDKTNANLEVYIEGLGNWVRGNDSWCYESKRYYGDGGAKIRETRIIILRSPEKGYLQEEQLKKVISEARRDFSANSL